MLTLVLLFQTAPVMQVGAQQLTLPEVELGEEILNSDVFYLASTAATLQEGANANYLLRVGRGGAAESESSVLIKISDMTAQYPSVSFHSLPPPDLPLFLPSFSPFHIFFPISFSS